MTLRARIAVISAAAVAVVIVLTVFIAQSIARNELLSEIDGSLRERADAMENGVAGVISDVRAGRSLRPQPAGPGFLLQRGDRAFDTLLVQFVALDGTPLPIPGQRVALPVEDPDTEVASGGTPSVVRTVRVDGDSMRMITVPLPGGGAVQMARSLAEYDASVGRITRTLTIAGGIGVVLAGLLGLLVARGVLRPVDRLTETVEHVTETGELSARIDIERDDEVGRLAAGFNAMLAALETSKEEQARLVRDAGHELRTPLTALRTNIELLSRTDGMSPDERRRMLDAATFELGELTTLVAELVELASDPAVAHPPATQVDLTEVVEAVAQVFRRRTGRTIDVTGVRGSIEVTGRRAALERAVGNLLDNADKWSPPGAGIEVTVANGTVSVADHGPGIAPGDRTHVFDRFYRTPEARSQPGSGLGLAIVAKIVEEHGGETFASDTPGGGATVGFHLPPA